MKYLTIKLLPIFRHNFNSRMNDNTDKKKRIRLSATEVVLISLIVIVVAMLFITLGS